MKIVSGGQTGVDRAALDVALSLGVPVGGWCPAGRLAEDGRIPERYPLIETRSAKYSQRTRFNVRDSDATLILNWGAMTGGTLLTKKVCQRMKKPHRVVNLAEVAESERAAEAAAVRDWIESAGFAILNVAGPRESLHAGAHQEASEFLAQVFSSCRDIQG